MDCHWRITNLDIIDIGNLIKPSDRFNTSLGCRLKIGNLVIFTIGTAGAKFTNNMVVAIIDESIIPKRVKNGLPFSSQPSTCVKDYLSPPILTISAEINVNNKNKVLFTGVGPNLDTEFSGYCTLIYEI